MTSKDFNALRNSITLSLTSYDVDLETQTCSVDDGRLLGFLIHMA